MNIFVKFLNLLLISALCISCNQKKNGDAIPIRKVGGAGGGGSIPQKPDRKASEEALKHKVLVLIDKSSQVSSANEKAVVFNAKVKINEKMMAFPWLTTFKIEIGKLSEVQTLSDAYGLGEYKLGLSVQAKRLENNKKKDSLGLLVLAYQLGFITDDQDKSQKSVQIVVVNTDRIKSPKAVLITEVIYPVPEDFSLENWIEQHLKQP